MACLVQNLQLPLYLASILLFLFMSRVVCDGGMVEMKALTGDAPYLGGGNHQQTPEYFGDSVYRQYYKDVFGAPFGRGRFAYNSLNGGVVHGDVGYGNSFYGASGYRMPYRGYDRLVENYGNYGTNNGNYRKPIMYRGNVRAGGYYTGHGNDWV